MAGLRKITDELADRLTKDDSLSTLSARLATTCFKLGLLNQKLAGAFEKSLASKSANEISARWILVEYLLRNKKNVSSLLGKNSLSKTR